MARRVIGDPGAANARLKALIGRIAFDPSHLTHPRDVRDDILAACHAGETVLDCGRSMRDRFEALARKAGRVDTLDINAFADYPDIQADLSQPLDAPDLAGAYDRIVCLAVLEHCHDPFAAMRNLRMLLRPGGTLHLYVPFIYQYHAPKDLHFQDYWRFTRDALALLLADFSQATLAPVRGRTSAALRFLFPGWKNRVERFGVNPILDRWVPTATNLTQCSGYNVVAIR